MAEYSELPGLVREFKRAAIDAYMRTQPYAWTIDGDHYEINSSSTHTKVTRPGPDGEGGGDWSSDNFIAEWFTGGSQDEQWTAAFDSIRSRIDTAIEPWLTLPDPADLTPEVEECRQITRRLSGAAAASAGGQSGAGIIPGNISLVIENSSAMSGTAIAAFKSNFLAQLGPVIGGQHGISLVLGSALAAEEGLWEAARSGVADIVAAARDASQSLADSGSSGNLNAVLEVAGWAVKGAKVFLPGAGAVLEVGSLGIEILSGTPAGSSEEQISGADAEAVIASFEDALAALNQSIADEESQLQTNLNDNLANIAADQSSYDLSVPGVRNDPADPDDVIAYQPALIAEITKTYLPTIAGELTAVSTAVLSASMSSVMRDASIGIGARGPGTEWARLRWLLHELLKNLSWDVTNGATNLDLVLQDLQGHEQRIADEIEQVLALLDAGNPTDPWD
ncbi:hypothetical protein AB0N73_11775 [Microbacterium sp. NPDC089189]|uniref:hypothetical protein n=1 Tax=Microbacterium sp. NPDC089189 TaxID=3154972 RepID=UPI0034164869